MHKDKSENGYMIILTMIIVFVLMGTGLAIASTVAANYASTKRNTYVDAAVSTAEAGVSDTISRLKGSEFFTGYPDTSSGRKVLYSNVNQGRAEYATTVTPNADNSKTIRSTGYVYANNTLTSAADVTNKKTVEVNVAATTTLLSPRIYAGSGGLNINYGSGPRSGQVYSMGPIRLTTGGYLGSDDAATNVDVVNMGCGDATSYPSLCPASDQPISVSNNSAMTATVCATNQVSSYRILSNAYNQGLQTGCEAEPIASPVFDKQAFYDRMNPVPVGAGVGSCGFGMGSSANWQPNTRFMGNVRVEFYCTATINGDVYIDGDFSMGGYSTLRVADNITVAPTIVVTGNTNVSSFIEKNNLGVSVKIISFDSTDSICSSDPGCVELDTPAKKLASRDYVTVRSVFADLDGAVLWSYFGKLDLGGPPPVGHRTLIGSLIGQTVSITHLAIVSNSAWTDSTPLASEVKFTGNYKVLSYKQLY
ncbi:hypothetical protein EON76_02665 [bacterium]|nr:MAG: hypothetical protein EON76_02665 [bacterium]